MTSILYWLEKILFFFLGIIALLAGSLIIVHLATKASNNREWSDDQNMLSYSETSGNLVSVHNVRNFTHASTTSYTINYYDKVYDLDKIKKIWYVVEPFSGIPGSAHTFLSFEFEDNVFVSISIEIRKQKGESYNPIKGLLNQYELMYVIADERDVIKLRSNYRKDMVYVYPIKASKEKVRALFLGMIEEANSIKDNPEFYNTLTNTCTTKIADHINEISPKKIPFSLKILFPANSDKLAYDLGLIDTDLSFDEARKKFYINDRAEKYANDPDFSVRIRQTN